MFPYSCEYYWVWFSCLLTTRGVWLSCLLTTQSRVYEIYTRVGAFDTPTQCSTSIIINTEIYVDDKFLWVSTTHEN